MIKTLFERFGAALWIYLAAIIFTLLVMISVPLGASSYDDWTGAVMFTVLATVSLSGAAIARYLFIKPMKEADPAKAKVSTPAWVLMWTLPAAITVVMLPWLISGILVDPDVTMIGSIFLWIFISYAALLLGFILVPFIIMPLELLGRALLSFSKGDTKTGVSLLSLGLYFGLFAALIICATLALSDLPPVWLSWGPIIFALLGIPGSYTVDSQVLLWVSRLLAVIIIAVPLAVSAADKRAR